MSDAETLVMKCSCGHLALHGWHLKEGCQYDDCACLLGVGGAILASDWLARDRAQHGERIAQAIEAERQRSVQTEWEEALDLGIESAASIARSTS